METQSREAGTWICSAAKHFGQQEKCTAPEDRRRRCRFCSHTVCDRCETPHCCAHDDLRRRRPDGYGYFGICNHTDVCIDCKGHGYGTHRDGCRKRPANVADRTAETKRQEQLARARAATDALARLVPRMSTTLTETRANIDILRLLADAVHVEHLEQLVRTIEEINEAHPPVSTSDANLTVPRSKAAPSTDAHGETELCRDGVHSFFCTCRTDSERRAPQRVAVIR